MWHLRRVHMESVGHPDARFDPLTVDLTDANGDPTSSVLWLENMGGKTSWLSLVFSTLRPSLSDFLGKPDKQLGDYVLGTDTAHIILEFAQISGIRTLTGSGTRLVLGQVLQWRQHRQEKARESSQLNRQLWGVLVPPTGGPLTFDNAVGIIRTDEHQRRPLTDFSGLIADRMQGDVLRPDSNQARWSEWLRHHGLDPEVFADQLKMSTDEGSISERFHFENGDELVQWALPYIIPSEVPDGIAAVVDKVKDTLAKRPSLQAQQQFCSAVESRLEYAATQQRQLDDQREDATAVWDSSLGVADQFRAAATASNQAVERHREEARVFDDQAKDAQSRRNQLQQQWREAQLVAAQLHCEEMLASHDSAQETLTDTQNIIEAWELTGSLQRIAEIESRVNDLDDLLAEADDQAKPLRKAVDVNERRLAAKLSHLLGVEQSTLADAGDRLAAARTKRAEADKSIDTARAVSSAAMTEVATAKANLAQLDDELSDAIRDGLLDRGQSVEDGATAKVAETQRLQAEVDRLVSIAKDAEVDAEAASDKAAKARQNESASRTAYEKAAAFSAAVTSEAQRVLDLPDVASAFDAANPDLWHDGPEAVACLARQADAAETDLVAIELRTATDNRAVDWLDRTGLLPPSQDVEDALIALAEGGIRSAFSGWEVLRAHVSPERHGAVISFFPEIVTGVVLTDPDELDDAKGILTNFAFSAPTVLVAGPDFDLESQGRGIVVLPGPAALHDEDAATEEGDRRQSKLDAASVERELATELRRSSRNAHAQLHSFLEVHPSESVAQLKADESNRLADQTQAQAAVKLAESAHAAAVVHARAALAAVQPLRDSLSEAAREQVSLRRLSERQSGRVALHRAAADAKMRGDDAEKRREVAVAARDAAVIETDTVQDLLRSASIRKSDIEGTLTRNGLNVNEDAAPNEPIDSLERALKVALQELVAVAPPDQMVTEREDLRKACAELGAALRRRNEEVVEMSRMLLSSAEGATAEARDVATVEAKSQLLSANEAAALAKDALRKAEADLTEKETIPPSRRSALDIEPTDAAEARALVDRLGGDASVAMSERDEASGRHDHHVREAEQSEQSAQAFRREADDLIGVLKRHASLMRRPAEVLEERRHASEWSGTQLEAEQERRKREANLDDASGYMRIATDERNQALDDVRHLASGQRELLAEDLPTLLPRLTEGPPDQRGAYADKLSGQLRSYAMSIEKQLNDLDRHRRIVIDHLTGKVKETVKLLERMQRRTRLPAGLDEWTDRPFLQLKHPRLPETTNELAGRVGTVVDRICDEPSRTATSGMELLYAAVSAAVGGPFEASILKPHKRLTDERVDISEMASFSGGQKVTAALVIFAALTRMRTDARSSGQQTNGALPLLLDNPIGKANQATLMEVQQRVADAFGLQLIYTTGLHDVGALASFNNIVRLDGRENPRSGRVHVVVDSENANAVYLDSIRLIQQAGTAG